MSYVRPDRVVLQTFEDGIDGLFDAVDEITDLGTEPTKKEKGSTIETSDLTPVVSPGR